MLQKTKIQKVGLGSEDWSAARLGKFTSSDIFNLFGAGAMQYVRRKVGEELTGKSAKGDIDVEATRWGNFYEAEAVNKFGLSKGLEFIIVQQLITEMGSRYGCTPDGLIVLSESPDKTEYEVENLEVKCPPSFDGYILLFECETPQDLKSAVSRYYWQTLDQMDNCGCLKGWFAAYHPDFKAGNMRTIRFDAMQPLDVKGKKTFPIYEDLKLLREKKAWAVERFDEIRMKLMKTPKV